MKYVFIILIMMFNSCGKDPGASEEKSLDGSWVYLEGETGLLAKFEGGRYEVIAMVVTGDKRASFQLERGTYESDNDSINFKPVYYSCPDLPAPSTYSYKLPENKLILTYKGTTIIMDRFVKNNPVESMVLTEVCF